ncbi:SMP-30/gluconolactonase/LRE family protein [Streptomyces toxytricini]|uniref:SMP-30/gluconolactonase/LRE family protein n=1 Tax=Streptomyces toxytricini TaxID=67369 RepID=A0ABW8EI42_STRT5
MPRSPRTPRTSRTRRGGSGAAAPALALAALALLAAAPAPASAIPPPPPAAAGPAADPAPAGPSAFRLSDPRVIAHYSHEDGQTPENIALDPDGSAYLTFALARQVAHADAGGHTRVIATLPEAAPARTPGAGAAAVTGIVRTHDGSLYVPYVTGTDRTGIHRIRPDGTVGLFARLPADGHANGLALDRRHGLLYAADSRLGTVWRISLHDASVTAWAAGAPLQPLTSTGANGIKVHHGAVWVSNSDRGTLLRIPVREDGTAGAVETHATGLAGIDDFAFAGDGKTVVAALPASDEVVLVRADGTRSTLLTRRDGISGPTSVAVRDGRVYVASASALATDKDPNLLVAAIEGAGRTEPAAAGPGAAHSGAAAAGTDEAGAK